LKAILLHSWQRGKEYLYKAGTLILVISILIWALGTFPRPTPEQTAGMTEEQAAAYALENSALGHIGKGMETVTSPMNFDWRINTALLGATAAKEVFVAQAGVVFSLASAEEDTAPLREILAKRYSPATGLALILFLLIATPCVATFAVVRRETGSWLLATLQWIGLTLLGYIVAATVVGFAELAGVGV
jgi:ferrous iron transport protein B